MVGHLLLVLAEDLYEGCFIILDTGQIFFRALVVLEEKQNRQILKRCFFVL